MRQQEQGSRAKHSQVLNASARSALSAVLFFFFKLKLLCISGHAQVQGWKSPLQKLRGKGLKPICCRMDKLMHSVLCEKVNAEAQCTVRRRVNAKAQCTVRRRVNGLIHNSCIKSIECRLTTIFTQNVFINDMYEVSILRFSSKII